MLKWTDCKWIDQVKVDNSKYRDNKNYVKSQVTSLFALLEISNNFWT